MCGIAGIIYKTEQNPDFTGFKRSAELMAHRGPDHFGEHYFGNTAIFHYRLSILDLDPRSNQPFYSGDKKKVMVYNGEVYNYRDLAAKHHIQQETSSDTEVLLKSLELYGTDVLPEWNGIFAFACLDETEGTLTLARDRFGVKPLYIYEDDEVIAFASEAKVILNWLDSFEISPKGLSEYLWYGNTLGQETLIEGVRKLLPGTFLQINLDTFDKTEEKYWSLNDAVEKGKPDTFDQAVKKTRGLLENAVQRQLISDVPVGVFLSGGIDSSAITAFASRHISGKLNTYSVEYDFNIGGKSELDKAALIAKKFGTNHHEIKVESKNLPETFEQLVFQYDEPFADAANVPLYLLANECKRDMRVVLQGDGGDEFFAGYRRYNLLNNLTFWKYATRAGAYFSGDKFIRRRLKRMAFNLNQKDDALRMAYMMSPTAINDRPESIFTPEWQERISHQNPFEEYHRRNKHFEKHNLVQRMLYTDTEILLPSTYLEKVDKATMLCSIEARVPFLDNELTDYVLGLPSSYKVRNREKKYLLKKVLAGVVPDEILYAPKRGFDMPYKKWLQTTLYDYAKEKFSNFNDANEVMNKARLIHLLEDHKQGLKDNGVILWKALVLVVWLNQYADKLGSVRPKFDNAHPHLVKRSRSLKKDFSSIGAGKAL